MYKKNGNETEGMKKRKKIRNWLKNEREKDGKTERNKEGMNSK